MTRLATLSEILKQYDNALFTIVRANGEEIFKHPLTSRQVRGGIDKKFLGCCVENVDIEDFLNTEFITVNLRY